jgi:hypothetical protein
MELKTLKSTGFAVNTVNLLLIAMAALGITTDLDGATTIEALLTKNYEVIFTFIVPSLTGVIYKVWELVKMKVNIWQTLVKSPNFWNQVIVLILGVVTGITSIVFPEDAAGSVVDALVSMNLLAIVSAIAMNIITPILYALRNKNKAV